MSRSPIRIDKTCLNCFYVVDRRYCSNCGQENIEPRKTFHHLFVHFIEDLTHYENAFWKTIRNLIAKPAALTKEYMSGKRMSYLAPVRLYIFISFVTFFLVAIIAKSNSEAHIKSDPGKPLSETKGFVLNGYKSVAHLDSLQKFGPKEERLSPTSYSINKKILFVFENNTQEEFGIKFLNAFYGNLPKVLFIYMPIFAFVLWIFQSKKKYFYFDHGIFTLHYFSFLLLFILLMTILKKALNSIGDNAILNTIEIIINIIGIAYMFYYFFPAHHRYYGETRAMSIIKGGTMFFINMFTITTILVVFIIYTLVTLR